MCVVFLLLRPFFLLFLFLLLPFLVFFRVLLLFAVIFAIIFASYILQWAAPDFIRELQIAMGSAGPQQGIPDHRASPRGLWSGLGNAGPHPGGSGAEWAAPDLTRGAPERSGQQRTSISRRYVKRYVRNTSDKNVRRNIRRYIKRYVRQER